MIDSPLTGKTAFLLGPLPVDQAVVTTWGIMAVLGLWGGAQIIRQARRELDGASERPPQLAFEAPGRA